jgi:hypothetical protein
LRQQAREIAETATGRERGRTSGVCVQFEVIAPHGVEVPPDGTRPVVVVSRLHDHIAIGLACTGNAQHINNTPRSLRACAPTRHTPHHTTHTHTHKPGRSALWAYLRRPCEAGLWPRTLRAREARRGQRSSHDNRAGDLFFI